MIGLSLGKRYERLLFFTAPVTLAAMFLLLAAIGSATQKDRRVAVCYARSSTLISENMQALHAQWEVSSAAEKKLRRPRAVGGALYTEAFGYRESISKLFQHDFSISVSCFESILAEIKPLWELKDIGKHPPSFFLERFEKLANDYKSKPLVMYGVQLESSTTYDVVGTKIKVDLSTLVLVLQVALLPILLTWLGSLYATRYRETLLIQAARSQVEIYPHVVNVYVTKPADSRIRRKKLSHKDLVSYCNLYAVYRAFLLSCFVVPASAAYIASVLLMNIGLDFLPFMAAALASILTAVFVFAVLMIEFFPSHRGKNFPWPIGEDEY